MPDPAPAAPAPAAAAASTPPPPTPSPAPNADAKPTSKELAGKLIGLLTAPSPALDAPPKPAEKPATTPAPAAPAAPSAPQPDGGIKRRKDPKTPEPPDKAPPVPKKEDLNKPAPGTAPAPAAPAAPKTPEPTDADFEKELVEEERVLLDDARAAEKYLPEKYKGHSAKMTTFLKESVKRLAAVEKGELDGKPWEQADYQKWYEQNVPKVSLLDQRQVQRLSVKDDLKKDFEPQIENERHARWIDTEQPKIRAKGDDIYRKLSNGALPDEVMTAITERTKGLTVGTPEYRAKIDEVQKDYALEFEIAQNVINVATGDIEEFHRLTTVNPATQKPLTAFDAANPVHERLVNMVTEICNEFKTTGGADLKKEGKWFVTREEWQGMAPEQRGPFWTFTNDQIIERALGKVKGAVSTLVSQERKKLEEKYGFKRTFAAAPAAPAPAPAPAPAGAPPAPRPAPAGGGGGSAPQPSVASMLAGKLTSQPPAQ
jgi:hypothetical protein